MSLTVSVLVPAYNSASTLGATLKALLVQTRQATEIIVCDDGSTDDTAEIAAGYPRVRVIRKANGGVSSARNAMLDVAVGDVLMFCDADDIPHPDWIARLVGRMEETESDLSLAGLSAGADLSETRYVYPCTEPTVIPGGAFYEQQLKHPAGTYSYLPCCAIRRSVVSATPPLRMRLGLKVQEDEVFMLAVARRCRKVALSPESVYDYIFRSDSACATYLRGRRCDATMRYQYFLRDAEKFRVTGRLSFAVRALLHFARAWGRRLTKGEKWQ